MTFRKPVMLPSPDKFKLLISCVQFLTETPSLYTEPSTKQVTFSWSIVYT